MKDDNSLLEGVVFVVEQHQQIEQLGQYECLI
jgi:hypothetical protein